MIRNFIFLFIAILNFNCRYSKELSRESISILNGEREKKTVFLVPRYLKKVVVTNSEGGIEIRYLYKDSAIFYITNIKSGSEINRKSIYQNIDYYNCIFSKDSCSVFGSLKNSMFWGERKVKSVFFGYSMVDSTRLSLFNHAIYSLNK